MLGADNPGGPTVHNMGKTLAVIAFVTFSLTSAAARAQTCGPGNPLDHICQSQAAVADTLTDIQASVGECTALDTGVADLQSSVDGLQSSVDGLQSSVDGLQTSVDGLQTSVDGLQTRADGLQTSVDALSGRVGEISQALEAHAAAAHPFWTSPLWLVHEGASTTSVNALNLGADEVEVVFAFFNADGTVNSTFSTSRLVAPGGDSTIFLDDRGVDPAQHGWFAVLSSGPIQVDGYVDFGRGDAALSREYGMRTLSFTPVGCEEDPSTWPKTNAPFLCSFIDRELTRLWP